MSIRSIVPTARSGSTGKVVSAREAVRLIRVGDTVAIGGFFEIGLALEVIHELGALFEATDEESAAFGKPRDLTLVFCGSRLRGTGDGIAWSVVNYVLVGGESLAVIVGAAHEEVGPRTVGDVAQVGMQLGMTMLLMTTGPQETPPQLVS